MPKENVQPFAPLRFLPELLLPWFPENQRELPWRRDREPYHVWLSEIMLQQTRVEAVKGYYARFLESIPDIATLAGAEETLLLKLWEGLGYYSRVRNLQKAAKVIVEKHGGVFPRDYASIRALPGIGDYTAGAISSICFDEKTPAVDGNVLRVVSRVCCFDGCTDDPPVKRQVRSALEAVYPQEAGCFTQALMELGAIVCVPNGDPLCHLCPLSQLCLAKKEHRIHELPVRAEKKTRRVEDMTVFLMTCEDSVAICRRPKTGLLAGLYQFPNVPDTLSEEEIIETAEAWSLHPRMLSKLVTRKHIFTHIQWNMQGARLYCQEKSPQFLWVTREELSSTYALPTAFRQFVEDIWEATI